MVPSPQDPTCVFCFSWFPRALCRKSLSSARRIADCVGGCNATCGLSPSDASNVRLGDDPRRRGGAPLRADYQKNERGPERLLMGLSWGRIIVCLHSPVNYVPFTVNWWPKLANSYSEMVIDIMFGYLMAFFDSLLITWLWLHYFLQNYFTKYKERPTSL